MKIIDGISVCICGLIVWVAPLVAALTRATRAQSAAVQVGSIRAALSRTLIGEVRFATDSPLEGDGFEPSVPRKFLWCPVRSPRNSPSAK
jgi:hypothetical protein